MKKIASTLPPVRRIHARALAAVILGSCLASCVASTDDAAPGAIEPSSQALESVAFFDDFSAGLTRWSETGEGDWNTEALISSSGYPGTASGAPAAHADGCTTSCTITTATAVDLSAAIGGRLEFLRFISSLLDAGEFLEAQAWNGSAWVRVGYWTDGAGDDSQWRATVVDLAPYAGVADFRVRFITRESSTFEHVHVDDVRIVVETDDGGGVGCGDAMCESPETCSTCPADCGACPGGELFFDPFANLGQWTESGEGDWNVESLHSSAGYPSNGSGAPAAHSDNCDNGCTLTLANPIDLSGVEGATLQLLRFVDSDLDSGDFLRVELFDGASWNTVFNWTQGAGDDNVWHQETLDLGAYVGTPSFRIRLSTRSSTAFEHVHVDDVRVTAGAQGGLSISRPNLEAHVGFLAQAPRAVGDAHLTAARNYCADRLAELGFAIELQAVNASGFVGQNVIGTLPGTDLPDQRVVVSAHIDGVFGCRGAYDNASGVAGLLESARVLSATQHRRTLVAGCWDLEEVDLLGSEAYAQRARAQGQNVRVSFVFDMIGFKTSAPNSQQIPGGALFGLVFPQQQAQLDANQRRGDFIAIVTDAPGFLTPGGGAPFLADLQQAAQGIGLSTLAIEVDSGSLDLFQDLLRSDHASFWAEDYTAMVLTDSGEFRNPNYHCNPGDDIPATLDYDFMRQVTQATATAALQALDE